MMKLIAALLGILAIWDLWKKELPIGILVLFAIVCFVQFLSGSFWIRCLQTLNAGTSLCLLHWRKSGEIGSGDIWVLVCLGLAWPMDVFWRSLLWGFVLISLTGILLWGLTKNQEERLPLIPFLLMGYWI